MWTGEWIANRFKNKEIVMNAMCRYVERNKIKFIEIIVADAVNGNKGILRLLDKLINSVIEDDINPYREFSPKDIGTIILNGAKHSTEYLNKLIRCYTLAPKECTEELVEVLASFNDSDKSLDELKKYICGFCYTFGVACPIDHEKALRFLDDTKLIECRILHGYLRMCGDHSVRVDEIKGTKEFRKLKEEIEEIQEIPRRQFLLCWYDTLTEMYKNRIIDAQYASVTFEEYLTDKKYFDGDLFKFKPRTKDDRKALRKYFKQFRIKESLYTFNLVRAYEASQSGKE